MEVQPASDDDISCDILAWRDVITGHSRNLTRLIFCIFFFDKDSWSQQNPLPCRQCRNLTSKGQLFKKNKHFSFRNFQNFNEIQTKWSTFSNWYIIDRLSSLQSSLILTYIPGPDEVVTGERRQSSGRGGRGGRGGGPARPRPDHANSAPRRRRTRYTSLQSNWAIGGYSKLRASAL